jgi:hypothetical protein
MIMVDPAVFRRPLKIEIGSLLGGHRHRLDVSAEHPAEAEAEAEYLDLG